MFVTGVQSAGAKGVNNVQVAAVDTKEITRIGRGAENENERSLAAPRAGDPQPVVFPRSGNTPLDQRPVSLRQQVAADRYRRDGGEDENPDDRDERARR
jgi:hypothetical protein